MTDRASFFSQIHSLSAELSQSQVDGFNSILDSWDGSFSSNPISYLAYCLATAWHETARTMQPIHEYGSDGYFTRMYDPDGARPDLAASLGNTEPGDGVRFAGRGLVQLTGRKNYSWASSVTGHDCTTNPDLLLDPQWASLIMFTGMLAGTFTGKSLADYLPDDPVNARRIINGLDQAQTIAGYHAAFLSALQPSEA